MIPPPGEYFRKRRKTWRLGFHMWFIFFTRKPSFLAAGFHWWGSRCARQSRTRFIRSSWRPLRRARAFACPRWAKTQCWWGRLNSQRKSSTRLFPGPLDKQRHALFDFDFGRIAEKLARCRDIAIAHRKVAGR